MSASTLEGAPARHKLPIEVSATTPDGAWKPIYTLAAVAALLAVACIVVAAVVLITTPPPTDVGGWFALFQRSGILGLLDLDLMMLVSYVLMGVVYLALYGALRSVNQPSMLLALVTALVSIAAYFSSNPAFGMLVLSNKYAVADAAERSQLLAAGQALLANWQGSAYDVSYVLGAVPLLIVSILMLRSATFNRTTAYVGLVLGVLMIAPATAGPVGLVLAFVSLVPMVIWLVLVAVRFFQLGSGSRIAGAHGNSTYSLELRLTKEGR